MRYGVGAIIGGRYAAGCRFQFECEGIEVTGRMPVPLWGGLGR